MRAVIILALLCMAACSAPTATATDSAVQEQVARFWTTERRTVLTGDAALALTHQCSRISPGPVAGQWTPSAAQLDALEDQLILLLSRRLEASGQSPSRGDYARQYAGFIINGRQVIYVNGFISGDVNDHPNPDHPFDWRTQAVGICDGGTITFGAEYDVETRALSHFEFNGAI